MAEKLSEVTIKPEDFLRLEILSKAQDKQIRDQNKKIVEFKEEINKLKRDLDKAKAAPKSETIDVISNVSVEELICMQEIGKLKSFSDERELTHEEAKKLEIYVKVLNGKKQDEGNKKDTSTSKMSDAELLQFMQQLDTKAVN
jgi:hypothetical protein